ncbi:putative disease resistance protein At1g50180 [Apium graveolens]|uniref:putative disease resistance protein At1g50180 n=1 Tax=Apium graveolens TaxID=4045 RepID=UPI003D7924FE
MAEAVVSLAVTRLGDLLISTVQFPSQVRNQVEDIQTELTRMQCFLADADKRQGSDSRVRSWVSEIRDLAHQTEDVIEIYALQVEKKTSRFQEFSRSLDCIMCQCASLYKVGKEIDIIKYKLSSVTTSLQTYGVRALEGGDYSNSKKLERISYSHLIERDFVGMEEEIEILVSHLKNKRDVFEVISIWGMGGQGKTTLANKIYNHIEVRAHFQAFAWVCITQQFDREKVLKSIFKELVPGRREEISNMEDSELVRELYNLQKDTMCMIVVDDIWTLAAWECIRPAFPVGEETIGSKILLTTRIGSVAGVGSMYKLRSLTEKEGLLLLFRKAFPEGVDAKETRTVPEIEDIGRNMVQKCQGLPLAISTIGGILKGKVLRDWELINKDISQYLSRGEGLKEDEYFKVRQVLALSYDNLPLCMRHCFLYLGNFKEDEKIYVEELYLLWIAEGLVTSNDQTEGEMMLDVAERYMVEMVQRSLLEVDQRDVGESWSIFRTCRVHDLIRDMCLSKGKEENFLNLIDFQHRNGMLLSSESKSRRDFARILSIYSYDDSHRSSFDAFDENVIRQLRSLLFFRNYNGSRREWPGKILCLKKFKLLRVLMLTDFDFRNGTLLPLKRVGKLVYLKYLSFLNCSLEELPSSIGKLKNLQTLDLRVRGDINIPNVLWKLKQLKHLYLPLHKNRKLDKVKKLRLDGLNDLELIRYFDTTFCETNDLMKLRKLQVFHGRVIVKDLQELVSFISSNLLRHSTLDVKDSSLCSEDGNSRLVQLLECPFINSLWIDAHVGTLPKNYDHSHFSQFLTRIVMVKCEFEEDPMILLEKLPNLQTLQMANNSYLGKELVCSAMGFPQLKKLWLHRLPHLTTWRVDGGAMSNISSLQINKCLNLVMLPHGLRFLLVLKELLIVNMPETFKDRVRVIGGVEGEDFYKIRHIPYISI